MKLKKFLSLLLALVMTVSLLTLPAHAEDTEAEETSTTAAVNFTNVAPLVKGDSTSAANAIRKASLMAAGLAEDEGNDGTDTDPDNGMKISKTAAKNADGTYKITLEAYATGSKIISEVTKDVPTDIILVLDQSGSMGDAMTKDTYVEAYPGNDHSGIYYIRENGFGGYSYTKVTWCSTCNRWTDGCNYGHRFSSKYTPKTDASDNDRNHDQFYTLIPGITRLNALKAAVTQFAQAVADKAAGPDGDITTTTDNINHRIAVVGFASESGYGNNTELLSISGRNSGSVGVAYGNITNQNLKDVVQNMDTSAGKTMVDNAINALAASGATEIDLGLDMAERILNANPVSDNEERNRVVIVFTDGAPTAQNGFQRDVADDAISTAKKIKDDGTTVYSIGIFSGADATSAGKRPDKDFYDYGGNPYNYTEAEMSAACNWFMQQVSSNNGTPKNPSYYLSAADTNALDTIFKNISDQIETGGSSSKLTDEAVVKDIISPYFTLPAGADTSKITLETYECTGVDADGKYTWRNNNDAMGAVASITGNQVSVTGFDFSENYVGTVTEGDKVTYRGNKLVISFDVRVRDGFLGGNEVFTNDGAGIYKDGKPDTPPTREFEKPTVNVPIQDVTVKAVDKNVYLLGSITADQLKKDAEVRVGNVKLDLSKDNYGLESWQTEYVNITVTVKDGAGNIVSDKLDNLTGDTTYTVEVTVAPNEEGTSTTEKGDAATAKTGVNDPAANIYVFTPELTYKDSTAYYGETASNDYSGNFVSEVWKHGDTVSTSVTMFGEKPTLDLTYTADSTKLNGDKYGKEDVPVKAEVKIGAVDVTNRTKFVHEACASDCGWTTPENPGDPAFLIHIKTCTLKVTKAGGASDESYVFTVEKDGEKYSEVTVWGNGTETLVELPVGTYTIQEDANWSWRYGTRSYSDAVTLDSSNTTGTITCTNTKTVDNWLNGFSQVVRNIFGIGAKN